MWYRKCCQLFCPFHKPHLQRSCSSVLQAIPSGPARGLWHWPTNRKDLLEIQHGTSGRQWLFRTSTPECWSDSKKELSTAYKKRFYLLFMSTQEDHHRWILHPPPPEHNRTARSWNTLVNASKLDSQPFEVLIPMSNTSPYLYAPRS